MSDGATIQQLQAELAACREQLAELQHANDERNRRVESLRKLLDQQERERQLVAFDLHDGLVQDLVGAKMMIEAVARQVGETQAESLDKVQHYLSQAIGEGRRLIAELRPILLEGGVHQAIEQLIRERRSDAWTIHFSADAELPTLEPLLEGAVYRVVQEALTNAERHGHAKNVEVRICGEAGALLVEINDDGVGFDVGAVDRGRFGLEGIRQRAQLFGGRAEIQSSPGAGSRIKVRLPILPAADADASG